MVPTMAWRYKPHKVLKIEGYICDLSLVYIYIKNKVIYVFINCKKTYVHIFFSVYENKIKKNAIVGCRI
jgi:hypothetical protein